MDKIITTTSPAGSDLARVSKFSAVGIVNTAIDFGLYNVMFAVFGLSIIVANLISTTVAMVFSFFANRHVVFEAGHGRAARQAVLFLVTTAFGLYVLQLGIIKLLTDVWTGPLTIAVTVVHGAGLTHLSDRFIRFNGAKAIGTVASLIWNYFVYKRVVFK